MRVVVDTNVLVSGIFWAGVPGRILDRWAAGVFVICANQAIMEEYSAIIARLTAKMGREDLAMRWISYLSEHVELVPHQCRNSDCRDPDDAKFVECAIDSGARYIVSGDKDLSSMTPVKGFDVVSAVRFLALIAD